MSTPIYLDYQATVPTRPEVIEAVQEALSLGGNPNSAHSFGRKAAASILRAKDILGEYLCVTPKDIVFTSGATESIELALIGVVESAVRSYPENTWNIITSPIEHSAVLDTLTYLTHKYHQLEIRYLDLDDVGQISLESLENSLDTETLMVTVMYANNEIGTIYPIRKIGKFIQKFRTTHNTPYPLFHSDATQALGYLDMDISYLGLDLMTISAHKIGGPIGIGALYASAKIPIIRIRPGKGEESGLKSGTISPALAAGFAQAILSISASEKDYVKSLQKYAWEKLSAISSIEFNGPEIGAERLPCNIHVSTGIPSDELMMQLDLSGIAVSAGSACHSRAVEPSHVMRAITHNTQRIHSALRISFGYASTESELDFLVKMLSNSIT